MELQPVYCRKQKEMPARGYNYSVCNCLLGLETKTAARDSDVASREIHLYIALHPLSVAYANLCIVFNTKVSIIGKGNREELVILRCICPAQLQLRYKMFCH